jgi:hypothetical protein
MSLVGRLPSTTALHAVQGFAACNPSLLKNNACNVSLAKPLTLSSLSHFPHSTYPSTRDFNIRELVSRVGSHE